MRIFVDTCIVRHAATRYRTQTIRFGQRHAGDDLISRDPIQIRTKDPHKNSRLRSEISKLRELSYRLKIANATLLMDQETLAEVRKAGSFVSDYFYRSQITVSEPPIAYTRVLGMPRLLNPGPTDNHFHNFLSRLDHPRFLHIARYAGGLQGDRKNHGQLADAYFLWCAEHNNADYFLTTDSTLKRCIESSSRAALKTSIVLPSELLNLMLRT